MSATSQQQSEVVASALSEISHIATLPEITLRIIDLVEDPASTAQDLHDVIQNDPALCSRILKVVNSSFYGLPGQIGSINRAIVLLGLNAVKNIAIAASLAKLFRGGDLTANFSAKDLWMHSNATACGAKLLADHLKIGLGDEAFLSGLVHDIGIMVEMQFDRNRLIEVVEQLGMDSEGVPAIDMREVEIAVLGASHTDFGFGLCEKWKFPRTFAHATGYHHTPLELPQDQRTLPALTYVADRIAARSGFGCRVDLPSDEVSADVLDALKLTTDAIDKITERVIEQMQEEGPAVG